MGRSTAGRWSRISPKQLTACAAVALPACRYRVANYVHLPRILSPLMKLPGLRSFLIIGRPTMDRSGGLAGYRDSAPKSARRRAPFLVVIDTPGQVPEPKYRWCARPHCEHPSACAASHLCTPCMHSTAQHSALPAQPLPLPPHSLLCQPVLRRVEIPLPDVFKLDTQGLRSFEEYLATRLTRNQRRNHLVRTQRCGRPACRGAAGGLWGRLGACLCRGRPGLRPPPCCCRCRCPARRRFRQAGVLSCERVHLAAGDQEGDRTLVDQIWPLFMQTGGKWGYTNISRRDFYRIHLGAAAGSTSLVLVKARRSACPPESLRVLPAPACLGRHGYSWRLATSCALQDSSRGGAIVSFTSAVRVGDTILSMWCGTGEGAAIIISNEEMCRDLPSNRQESMRSFPQQLPSSPLAATPRPLCVPRRLHPPPAPLLLRVPRGAVRAHPPGHRGPRAALAGPGRGAPRVEGGPGLPRLRDCGVPAVPQPGGVRRRRLDRGAAGEAGGGARPLRSREPLL